MKYMRILASRLIRAFEREGWLGDKCEKQDTAADFPRKIGGGFVKNVKTGEAMQLTSPRFLF